MFLNNQKGFSLIQVIAGAGMMGAVAMGFMQLNSNMSNLQMQIKGSADKLQLREEIKLIIGNPTFCEYSFAYEDTAEGDPNPLVPRVFNKQDADQEDEGLDVSIWITNDDGTGNIVRAKKKFSGADNDEDFSYYENLKIAQMYLQFKTPNGGVNYPFNGTHQDIANLKLVIEKRMGTRTTNRTEFLDIPVNITMNSDGLGNTTITGCNQRLNPTGGDKPYQVVAIHSQSDIIPGDGATLGCPAGWDEMWTGWSLLMMGAGGHMNADFDLGNAGSCRREFRRQIFWECTEGGNCRSNSPDDFSYWLSDRVTGNTGAIAPLGAARNMVSRCKVCGGPARSVMAFQGTRREEASCPAGWTEWWSGFTLVSAQGGSSSSYVPDISSPGSCLRRFSSIPFIECRGNGCELRTGSDYTSWMSGADPLNSTTSYDTQASNTVKCKVCYLE